MYVHIGGGISVTISSISSIINLETVPASQKNISDFVRAEDENNRLQYLTGDIPKTLVLTETKTYVCPVSAQVLLKRLTSTADSYTDD